MQISAHKQDILWLLVLIVILFGIPFGIRAYDEQLKPDAIHGNVKTFILTGHAQHGWLVGEVRAYHLLSPEPKKNHSQIPTIKVNRGDTVVLKLRSSDITHGFSLKAYNIYVSEGILPGKTLYVSFKADKTGHFMFACNVFCGDIHPHMRGMLVVRG